MRRTRAHRRRERWVLAELETRIWPGRRATLFGYLWWWRYELGIAAGLPAALILLIRALGAGPTAAGMLATIGVCCFCPPARHAVATAGWRITTPHRLRAGFVQARIHSRHGRLPTVLRTSRQPFGERVRLWCPAGITAADLRSARDMLAAACWAADVQVSGDARHTHLVTLDVIRCGRPPEGPEGPEGHSFRNENDPGWSLANSSSSRHGGYPASPGGSASNR